MAMRRLEATYRITTPMFCSGADQAKAELRLPSFKGALRFWWRALMWREVQDVGELRQREHALFGASDQNYGQSKVRLRWGKEGPPALCGDEHGKWNVKEWQAYTGYGLIETLGTGNNKKRKFFKDEQQFTLRVGLYDASSSTQVENSLVALGLFGGMGGRSRKGWGSVQLERLGGATDWQKPDSVESLRSAIASVVKKSDAPAPPYTAFSRDSAFAIGPRRNSPDAAQQWVSEEYKSHIRSFERKPEREAFGLPRAHAGRNSGERRASPLFLHVHTFTDGKAVPVVLFLPGKFLPQQNTPAENWQRVREFVKHVEPR